MAKANSFEAEIDGILTQFGDECQSFGAKEAKQTEFVTQQREKLTVTSEAEIRRQILSVMIRNIIRLPGTKKPGVPVILTDDFWQALKNSRSDGDES